MDDKRVSHFQGFYFSAARGGALPQSYELLAPNCDAAKIGKCRLMGADSYFRTWASEVRFLECGKVLAG